MSRTLEQFIRFTTDSGTCSHPLSNDPPPAFSAYWQSVRNCYVIVRPLWRCLYVTQGDPLEVLFLRHDHWNPEASRPAVVIPRMNPAHPTHMTGKGHNPNLAASIYTQHVAKPPIQH